ncbi:polysulfide reductase NrfD [Corynebacterium uropygiale]|uniref:Polysulfide reductase NrfD n=1 Tax=Corynebacterium uropygiale TaxID=1775911 RepID=A0A9X1QSB5_9CORY|nr:NrfD/PsrC family molybdoenzyme membrane anchor subunit [Corynebacterium uropygiale]MCF4006868.1 polysulfide reductase NrfD [Corynebacterium uropygiale]
MTQPFDSYRPPEGARPRTRQERRAARRSGDGGREEKMVPKVHFDSYYGTPVVKAPPWKSPIGIYLFLGGVAGGSSLLALGSQISGNAALRRTARLAAFGAAASGSLALIADLGRPERMLNMFRVFKLSSPMNMGSWILGSFGGTSALAALAEIDDLTQHWAPLPRRLRTLLHRVVSPAAGVAAGALGAPLAVYTAVLLGDTSNPVWNEVKDTLPVVFVSSASLASAGTAMVFTPTADAAPARFLALAGASADLYATHQMMEKADPVIEESLREGRSGTMLSLSEKCVAAGLVGTLLGARRSRKMAVASGLALMAGSALTRFGMLYAGLDSVKDPRCVIEPQKRRLRARQDAGTVHDSITTAR